jgi:hypothetical protein
LQFHDRSSRDCIRSGLDLMQKGLNVKLPLPVSSELIFLHENKH